MKNYLNSHQRTIQGSFLILRDALQFRVNCRNQTIADVFSNAIEQQLKKLRIDNEPSYEKTLLVSYFPQFVFRFSRSSFPELDRKQRACCPALHSTGQPIPFPVGGDCVPFGSRWFGRLQFDEKKI